MNKTLFLSFLILFPMTLLPAQNGYWAEARGPWGCGVINTFVKTNDGRLYCGQDAQNPKYFYRSNDGGLNWTRLPNLAAGFSDSLLFQVRVGPSGAFFLRTENLWNNVRRWYKSTNEGSNWTLLDTSIVQLRETPSGAFIATRNISGVVSSWRSTDDGASWAALPAEVSLSASTTLVAPHGEIVYYWNNKILRSDDDGISWTVQAVPIAFQSLYFAPSGTILGVRPSVDNVYRSTNGGANFSTIGSLPQISGGEGAFIALNNGRILFQGNYPYETYFSDNDGASWNLLLEETEGAAGVFIPLSPLQDGTIFKSLQNTLFRSGDGGEHWQVSGRGIRGNRISDLKFVTDSLYFASSPVGLWRTTDDGENWELLLQNITAPFKRKNHFDITQQGDVVVIWRDSLLWSSDFGSHFTNITPPDGINSGSFNCVFISPYDHSIFLNGNNGMIRSSDYGQSWQELSPENEVESMAFHPSGAVVANTDYYAYVSSDYGNTWQWRPELSSNWLNFIAETAPNGNMYISRYNQLWRSEDAGITWVKLPVQLLDVPAHTENVLAITGNNHLYTLSPQGIILSVDNGNTWQNIAENTPSSEAFYWCESFAIRPDQRLIANFYLPAPYTLFQTAAPVIEGAYIEGYVRLDADADCSTADAQLPLKNRLLKAEGSPYSYVTNTDPEGRYIFFVDTGSYSVLVKNPSNVWWDYCTDTIAVSVPELFDRDTADFAALPLSFCPLMTVNVAVPRLRRCFNNVAFVSYCNQGTEVADSAWVDVLLDPYLTFVGSSQTHVVQAGNIVRFQVGNLGVGDCGQFEFLVYASCDSTVLGQTHCITAHGFPDTLCTAVPGWSGANLVAEAICQDTNILLKIRNTGPAHSEILDYIIIEDEVVIRSGQREYDPGQEVSFDFPAEGRSWRIESEQEPGHPFSYLVLAFAEGCDGFNSLGLINNFPVNGIQPAWHTVCLENTGSYDPNDKQGFPLGMGENHEIRPGQSLDYLIRFQNTGTDTAFTVVVRDTLSVWLDPLSFRPGASSHPYTWELSGQGVITFRFNHIMLPDSNVNEPGSHGFVQFNIDQKPEIPLGSVIKNSAAIYFDFNAPVITNTTWHTVAKSPLTSVKTPSAPKAEAGLQASPNPFVEATTISWEQKIPGVLTLNIFDSRGNLALTKTTAGGNGSLDISGEGLPAGLYWAELRDVQGRLAGTSKLVKQH